MKILRKFGLAGLEMGVRADGSVRGRGGEALERGWLSKTTVSNAVQLFGSGTLKTLQAGEGGFGLICFSNYFNIFFLVLLYPFRGIRVAVPG